MLALPENITGPINTQKWAIEGIPSEHVTAPWRRCWELLSRAVERFPQAREKWTRDALLCEVMSGQAQIWIAWSYDRRRIEGVVITRVFDKPDIAPNDKVCECPLAAGINMSEWGAPMFAMLKAWAIEQGCDYIAGYGRLGWKRLFGFTECGKTEDGLPILVQPLRKH